MSIDHLNRSAVLQMRIQPAIKRASEQVLHRIGRRMTDAVELFLRRVIVDQRLPFEVVGLDQQAFSEILAAWALEQKEIQTPDHRASAKRTAKGARPKTLQKRA